MPFVNFISGPTLVDLLAQQEYERRLAEYKHRQVLAWKLKQQEEYARQLAIAEEQAYREALRRSALKEQLEAERQQQLRQQQIEANREAVRQAKIEQQALLQEQARQQKIALQKRKAEEARRQKAAQAAARKAEEARRAEEARKAEEVRKAEEARRAHEARKAEEARQLQLRLQQEEDERLAREVQAAEAAKVDSSNAANPQQKYRVVEAPFPYFGYYLVPIEDEDEDADMEDGKQEAASDADIYDEPDTPEAEAGEQEEDEDEEVATEQIEQSAGLESVDEVPAPDSSDSEAEGSSEDDLVEKLNRIKSEVDALVESYARVFRSESESSSDSETSISSSAVASRIKVLQKAQLRLEKLYSELDELPSVPSSYKKLKRDLTSKSVSYADKIEDFLRVLEDHKVQAKLSEDKAASQPKEIKKLRRVTIETVDDDSDF